MQGAMVKEEREKLEVEFMQTGLSGYDDSWYKPGSAIKRISWLIINSLFFNHSLAVFFGFKRALLRMFGGKIGKGVIIKPSVYIKYPWLLEIGDHSWLGEKVNHNYKKPTFDLMIGQITLENGVWIGAKSTVCPGVTCKSHAVLAVGSNASKDLEAYGVYQGNPAVWVKARLQQFS